jgi:hypothetical protein
MLLTVVLGCVACNHVDVDITVSPTGALAHKVSSIASLSFDVSGAERGHADRTLTHPFAKGTEGIIYGASATKGNLVVAVTARDAGGATIGYGQSSVALVPPFVHLPLMLAPSSGPGGSPSDMGNESPDLAGVAQLAADPMSYDFGDTITGQTSTPLTVTISRGIGSDPGALTTILEGNDALAFVVSGDKCQGQNLSTQTARCTLVVTFAPTKVGAASATLTVAGATGEKVTLPLMGNALLPGTLAITPSKFDFGTIVQGQATYDKTFVISNGTTDSSGTITSALSGNDTSSFIVVNDSCNQTSLDPGKSCAVTLHFNPNAVNARAAVFTVKATKGASTAALTGRGIAAGTLAMLTTYDFGTVALGGSVSDKTIVVTNSGDVSTPTLVASLGGGDAASFVVISDSCSNNALDPGASCSVVIHFAAPADPGLRGAMLAITATPDGGGSTVLIGTGARASSTLTVSPSSYDFPAGGGETDFTISNGGTAASGTLASAINSSDASAFNITSDTCANNSIDAGKSCKITVKFAPSNVGKFAAALAVGTPSGDYALSALTGSLPRYALTVSPTHKDFGVVVAGHTNDSVSSFVITNAGDVPSGPLTIASSASSLLPLDTSQCSGTLAPGAQCTFTATFGGSTPERWSGNITVSTNGKVNARVDITGTIIAVPDPNHPVPTLLGVDSLLGVMTEAIFGSALSSSLQYLSAGNIAVQRALTPNNTQQIAPMSLLPLLLVLPTTVNVIGADAVAVYVKASEPPTHIDLTTLGAIYTCKVSDWSAVPGSHKSGPITAYVLPDSDETLRLRQAMGNVTFGNCVTVLANADEMAFKTSSDASAIGYARLGSRTPANRALALRSGNDATERYIAPTPAKILSWTYPLSRQLYLIATSGTNSPTGDEKTLLDNMTKPDFMKPILQENQIVPCPDAGCLPCPLDMGCPHY